MRRTVFHVAFVGALFALQTGCAKDIVAVSEVSPDGHYRIEVAERLAFQCSSDACVVVTLIAGSRRTELFRDLGWSMCFAHAEWHPDNLRVAIVASNCFGPPVAFAYDLKKSSREPLERWDRQLLKSGIAKRYGIAVEGDLMSWVKKDLAIDAFRARSKSK